MPTRVIREGILTSEAVNSLSELAELFYRRLQSVADDHGRFYSHPTILRTHCYPTKPDIKTDEDVKQLLNECITNDLIILYGPSKQYLHIVKFGQQTRSRSKFPEPSDDEMLIIRKADEKQMSSLDGGEDGVEGEGEYRLRARVSEWFHRRLDTPWGEKEKRALATIIKSKPSQEDIALLDAYYRAEIPSASDYRRRDLVTLLNNWNGELDRARRWKSQPVSPQPSQQSAWALKQKKEALETLMASIKARGSEDSMGFHFASEKDRIDYRNAKQGLQKVTEQIAKL